MKRGRKKTQAGLPEEGILGQAELREAARGSFQDVMRKIEAKVREALELSENDDAFAYVVALFPDTVVLNQADKRLVRYDWTWNEDNSITLSSPTEVVESFTPVGSAEMREAEPGGVFIEATDTGEAPRFLVRIIKAGLSGNRNYYPDAVLREAAPLFDGVRVFAKPDEVHLSGGGRDFEKLVGRIVEPQFVEGRAPDSGELRGTLEVFKSAGVAERLVEAVERKMTDLFGFSIDASGTAKAGKIGGQNVRVASKFREVKSVDLIVQPGAGGQVISLIEALQEEDPDQMLRDRMISLIESRRPDLAQGLDKTDDQAVETAYREALQAQPPKGSGSDTETGDPLAELREAQQEARRQLAADQHLREALADSQLPDAAKKKLRKDFEARDSFTEAQVDQAIKDEAAYLGQFVESGAITGLGEGASRVENGEDRPAKIAQMLDAFFDPAERSTNSFKECYEEITGDRKVTGMVKHCDQARLRESLGAAAGDGFREALDSTSFAQVLGDAIHRRMIAEYRSEDQYSVWREAANVVPVQDFRTNHRTRFGGYGDLPTVAEKGNYTALTSPTDEEATYAISKRGGTETVTLEMVRNDDVGAIQRIPIKLSRAARRTLSKFVLDFFVDNPVIYDGVNFFAAGHNNLGSDALDQASFAAARLAMLQQTEKDSGDRLGIGPAKIWVPTDLEESAVNIFRRNTENDRTFIQSLTPSIVPVWYWTDANDWVAQADPNDIPTIEVGFLDGNEEPELFVQDSPTVGSLFDSDQITWKIRHIYGGTVTDYRGAYKAVVA